jgi:hypothetical protein
MARPLRIEFAGALYDVMSRGNARQDIVRDDADREKRLDWLRRTVETYGWRIHSFVLMRNHDHLFVETPEPNLSAGMQYLNDRVLGEFGVSASVARRAYTRFVRAGVEKPLPSPFAKALEGDAPRVGRVRCPHPPPARRPADGP